MLYTTPHINAMIPVMSTGAKIISAMASNTPITNEVNAMSLHFFLILPKIEPFVKENVFGRRADDRNPKYGFGGHQFAT